MIAARYHFERVQKAQPQHTGALTGATLKVAKCDQLAIQKLRKNT